jgi:hypothetical protein
MIKTLNKIIFIIITYIIVVVTSFSASALPNPFDSGLTMTDQDLYSLPLAYSSADRIQAFLEANSSYLANLQVPIGFEDFGPNNTQNTDDLIVDSVFNSVPEKFRPRLNIQNQYGGTSMRVSDLIWKLTREKFGNSCLINYSNSPYRATTDICIDNEASPINPGLLLTLIQKESGFIYGSCSHSDAQNASYCQSNQFRLDRIVGYACFENPDPAKTCFDQNPNWKYSKGVFRQLFKAVRLLRIRENSCKLGGQYAFVGGGNVYQVGNNITIDNQLVTLKNGITCAMYIYTPHISAQQLTYNLLKQFQIDRDFIQKNGIDPNYNPAPIRTF